MTFRVWPQAFTVFNKYPFAKQKYFDVLCRIFWLQLSNKILKRRFEFKLHGDLKMVARSDFGSPVLSYYLGLYERGSMNFILKCLRKGDLFADVGANVGVYSLLAAGTCGARVAAFEPVPRAVEAFDENVAINKLESLVTLHRVGVGAAAGRAEITTGQGGANHIVGSVERGERTATIEIVTLDAHFPKECPVGIKIDVEGYESQVLNGAQRILSDPRLKFVIMEAISRPGREANNVSESIKILGSHGFAMYAFDPMRGLLQQAPAQSICYISEGDENCLFLRDADFIRARLGGDAYAGHGSADAEMIGAATGVAEGNFPNA